MCSIVTRDASPALRKPRPLEQIEREICDLAGHIAAATCRWLMLIAEFDERRGWAEWGVVSCAHWLSWRCSIAPRSGREHVRVARALVGLPEVRAAFAAGELSYSKVRAITRVATPESEAYLLELARHATGGQLDKLVRAYSGVLSATLQRAQEAHSRRALSYQWEDDGSLSLRARLPAEDGAVVLAALREAESTAGSGEPSTASTRRADALVTLARAAVADGLEGQSRGPEDCLCTVHVDVRTLAADQVHERSELEEGPVLPAETARRLSCDAPVVRIIERDGRPLSVGRRKRTVSPALRRALRSRDGGCRFPGCTHSRFLHAHHIQHWARGGPTTLANLVQLCSHHHRLVHEGGFGVESTAAGGLVFRRPDGRHVPSEPRSARPRGAGLEASHRRLGLVIDDRTCMPLSAGDSLDYGMAVDGLLARPPGGT